MGTTAEKLTYLNTTKQNLKTVINTTGAGLTDESTFRSYANVLNDKILGAINGDVDLFEEYPKVSGNGTDLSLNGVVEGKMSITPQGVSKQESTEGKNLFHILGLDVTTVPKVTSSSSVLNRVNNNEIVMTAVGTWSNMSMDFGENFFNTNQNIIVSADFLETISGRTSKVGLQFYGSTNGETYTSIQTTGIIDINYNTKQHLSVIANTGEYTYIRLRIWNNVSSASVSRGDSVINVSNIMVALGTDDTYEPYTGGISSPNPSYPFMPSRVTGENGLIINGTNLANPLLELGTIDATTGEDVSNNAYRRMVNYIHFGNANTLYFKRTGDTTNMKARWYDENKNYIGSSPAIQDSLGKTLTPPTNAKYLRIAIDNNNSNYFTDYKVIVSTSDISYIEHEEQNYQLSLGNIELNSSPDGTIRDGIIGKPNEWYKREYISKVVLNGSESYGVNSTGDGYISFTISNYINIIDKSIPNNLYSNMLKSATSGNMANTCRIASSGKVVISFKPDFCDYNSPALKEKLQTMYNNNNPLILYIPLVEYTDIPITDTTLISQLNDIYNNAHSYNGVTNITTTYEDGNEQMYLDIEALKNVWEVTE